MNCKEHPDIVKGLELGSAHVIWHAGGSAKEALRSLVILEQLLSTTEILVIKKTGCGMLTFKNEDARGVVQKNPGDKAAAGVKGLDFVPFSTLDAAVEDDVEWLRAQNAIPNAVQISG